MGAHGPRPPKSAAKPSRAAEDGPVSRFSKFLFEKVGTGMYYVYAKNIRHNQHAASAETVPMPPRATEDGTVGQFSKFLFEKVGTGMYYVHAKNIGRNPHPTETAPKPPRAAKHSPGG